MPRPWIHRITATFLALWLSLVGLEGSLAPCPMHQMSELAAKQGSTSESMAGMVMAPEVGGVAADSAPGHGTPAEHPSHRCSCPGSGCATPVGDLPGASFAFHAHYLRNTAPQFRSAPSALVPPDFLLPFATAPPVGSPS